jgi:diguanylate cyclase (GGDEF)-like protein
MYESFTEKLKRSLYLSAVDSITGVYNRSFFDDYIKNKEIFAENSAVLMIDIDKFKIINDKYGHAFADSVLKYVASTIKRHVRSSDLIARYGGDEFVLYMDNISKNYAFEVADRIQESVEASPLGSASCTVSIGVCCGDAGGKLETSNAISIADKFMYIAKRNGGNAVVVCA